MNPVAADLTSSTRTRPVVALGHYHGDAGTAVVAASCREQRGWRVQRRWGHAWRLATAAAVGLVAGSVLRGFFPPFVLDDPFWRAFWTSPAAAGVFALIGAVVAFGAAKTAAGVARRAAQRQEWWHRVEWALNLAISDRGVDRDVGLGVLADFVGDATTAEAQMINTVTSIVLTSDRGMDDGERGSQNDQERKRWTLWPIRAVDGARADGRMRSIFASRAARRIL